MVATFAIEALRPSITIFDEMFIAETIIAAVVFSYYIFFSLSSNLHIIGLCLPLQKRQGVAGPVRRSADRLLLREQDGC